MKFMFSQIAVFCENSPPVHAGTGGFFISQHQIYMLFFITYIITYILWICQGIILLRR